MIKTLSATTLVLVTALSTAQAQTVAIPANESFISQLGDNNAVTVAQTGGGNTQTTLQGAADPSALAKLPSSNLLTLGPSFNNFANTTQLAANGGSNTSTTIQLGAGSNVSNVMQVALAGGSNNQLTVQSGFGNIANTTQIAHAGLTNNSAIVQVGSHNTAVVSQK
jgi:hypothetical protein